MKKCIIVISHIMIFCIVLTFKAFSYEQSSVKVHDSTSSIGYLSANSYIVFNQYMNLNDVKVTFSQDDDNYKFSVSANSSVKIYGHLFAANGDSNNGALVPLLYKEPNFGNGMIISETTSSPYTDRHTGNYYTTAEVKIKNKTQSRYVYKYRLTSTEHITTESENTNNGEKYFIPKSLRNYYATTKAFYNSTLYPIVSNNNGIGVSLDRNSSYRTYSYYGNYYDTYFAYMDVAISINKKYIDDYRYLCFAQECIAKENGSSDNVDYYFYGASVCSNTIDLKEYVDCEHNWTYKDMDKFSHTKYCDKCKWEKNEPHSLLYEYDGIKYDICTCSYIDKVKYRFVINDDVTSQVEEVCDTGCSYKKHEYKQKTGYNFNWYEKYALKLKGRDNLSTISNATYYDFVATTSVIDDVAENNSVLYKAKYTPIKFTFKYSVYNNCDLKLDEKISDQEIHYNEKAYLKKSIDVKGYEFKGWTLYKGSDKIDFVDKQDVSNYSTRDLQEYTLYPVYEMLDYTLVYSSRAYKFSNGKNEKIVKYNYFDDGELERPNINTLDTYFDGYIDEYGNKYKTLSDVKNVIETIKKSNVTLHLKLSVGSFEIGRIERTAKGSIIPTSESMFLLNKETSGNITISETTLDLDYSMPYNYQYDYNYNKISGMSDTDEEIVDEEDSDDKITEDLPKVATMSFTNKISSIQNKGKLSKLQLLREFVMNNKGLCAAVLGIFILVLIIYEMLIIRYYTRDKVS